MKKPNRSMGFDEKPDPSRDVHLETGDYDDDDIIELEDIIEMPSGSIDEDEDLDMDVEILDAESDLEFEPKGKSAQAPAHKGIAKKAPPAHALPTADADDDLLKDFDFEADEEDLFEKLMEKGAETKPLSRGDSDPDDEGEDLLLQPLLDESKTVAVQEARQEEKTDPKERTAAAPQIDDRTDRPTESALDQDLIDSLLASEPPADMVETPAAPKPEEPTRVMPAREDPPVEVGIPETLVVESLVPEKTIPEAPPVERPAEKAAPPAPESTALKPESPASHDPAPAFVTMPGDPTVIPHMVEELMARIESRLMESVRALVEARLPKVAGDVIREEIEKIRKEIG